MNVPGLQTVRVIRRVRQRNPDDSWEVDDRGNAVYVDETVDVPGCSVQPSSTVETEPDGRTRVYATTTIYAPLSWPGGPIDGVLIDGARFNLQGKPLRWEHPRLGHVVVTAQEVSG